MTDIRLLLADVLIGSTLVGVLFSYWLGNWGSVIAVSGIIIGWGSVLIINKKRKKKKEEKIDESFFKN